MPRRNRKAGRETTPARRGGRRKRNVSSKPKRRRLGTREEEGVNK